jgi:hypothetical protein
MSFWAKPLIANILFVCIPGEHCFLCPYACIWTYIQVPECIEKLSLAGIKIWVLTGDKMETSISTGYDRIVCLHQSRKLSISNWYILI